MAFIVNRVVARASDSSGMMEKLVIIVNPVDEVLSGCIKFVAAVLGVEKFQIVDYETSWHENLGHLGQQAAGSGVEYQLLCRLPMIVYDGHQYPQVFYAGLCTVIRKMVHHANTCSEEQKTISLLGYQETCLKAYAEVSNWTLFCENGLPNAVNMILQECPTDSTTDGNVKILPAVLIKLENELGTPKNLPNKSKFLGKDKAKWLRKLIGNSFEGQALLQSVDSYVSEFEKKIDHCKSWSPYLIGFQVTIADLIVLYMVVTLFQKLAHQNCLCKVPEKIPMVFEWIEMMKVLPSAKMFIQSKVQVLLVSADRTLASGSGHTCTTWLVPQSDIDSVSQSKSDQSVKKMRVNHQSNISFTLEKIESLGISYKIVEMTDFPPSIDWNSHSDYLNPSKGDLNDKRSLRKQYQISNILAAVRPLVTPGCTIVDFCAGGGHVGIVLAYFFKCCKVILVENKEESVKRAVRRIRGLKLQNITICHSNLDYFCGTFNIGVTLHACGVATDLVLRACSKERASFVVCPCCYGSITNTELISYPRSQSFRQKLAVKDYFILSHSSDMTTWDGESMNSQLGRSSMELIDVDRCTLMEELGYDTSLRIMVPKSCSPKNHLLIGVFEPSKLGKQHLFPTPVKFKQ